jgi:phosphoribosylaminoimidazole carboxylase/phosphoribosylaminoimidazole-succinocarboxamide synthase
MLRITELVFEVLERAWSTVDHALIDMKIEFGVITRNGRKEIVLGDVIDNDSWRLWPGGDKRLMLDKQVYRNLSAEQIDEQALQHVKSKFELVAERTRSLFSGLVPPSGAAESTPEVAIILGSPVDLKFADQVRAHLIRLGVRSVAVNICSAHKATSYAVDVVAQLTQWPSCKAIIACVGLSNGLGPVASANTTIPVISCPPTDDIAALGVDVWSSLRLPSGLGATLALGHKQAAQAAAHIVGTGSAFVWSTLRAQQAYNYVSIVQEDAKIN